MCLSFLYRIGGSQRISLEGPSIDFLGVWLAQLGQATSIWNYITHATVGGGGHNCGPPHWLSRTYLSLTK